MENETRKPWGELSDTEVGILKKQQCRKCRYFSRTNAGNIGSNSTCDFILIEGHRRWCDPRDCVEMGVFKPRKGVRPKNRPIVVKEWRK